MASAYLSLSGETAFLNAGRSLTGILVDGDVVTDLVIGADQALTGDAATGRVLILAGGTSATAAVDLDDAAQWGAGNGVILNGAEDGDEFGWSVQNLGDVTGDGLDDLAIVARGTGTIYVVKGGALDFDSAEVGILDLLSTGDAFALTGLPVLADQILVSSVGDVDDDGVNDILVSASSGAADDEVFLVYGGTDADLDLTTLDGTTGVRITGLDLANDEGFNAGTIGDLNADGFADVLLGRPGPDNLEFESGDVVVLFGTDADLGASIDIDDATGVLTLTGLGPDSAPGASVSGGFDLNGDGVDDLALADPQGDAGGVNAGSVYVVFGASGLSGEVDLTTLDGTNGMVIDGLSAGDGLGAVVQGLGDVSGDGRDDLGLLTAAGDLYVIFGVDSATGFAADFDLATLNGSNGFAVTGLFDATPDSLALTSLENLNGDKIREIAIGATFDSGTDGETVVILGGTANFAALDAADGLVDGTVDFNGLGEVSFAETDTSIIVTGDVTGALGEDDLTGVSGAISIVDLDDDPDPTFATTENQAGISGTYGALVVNAGGTLWTYTIADNSVLQYLNDGQEVFDTITLVASNGSSRTITVTIEGEDDAAVFTGETDPITDEDIGQFTRAFTLSDVDDATLGFDTLRFDGTYGHVIIEETGTESFTYTYFQTSAVPQGLSSGSSYVDAITLTDDAGNDYDLSITIEGIDEGVLRTFTAGADTIRLGLGADRIAAGDGDDDINTGGGNDEVDAGAGNDIIVDAMGNDTVSGGTGADSITLLAGDNTVDGGADGDLIRTGYGNDTIEGGDGNDLISADSLAGFMAGNDRVTGGAGNDMMEAGAGADTFVFRTGDGNDIIASFDEYGATLSGSSYIASPTGQEFTSGLDTVALYGFTTVNAGNVFDFITNVGGSAVFSAEGTQITFYNVLEAGLSVDDFEFYDIV